MCTFRTKVVNIRNLNFEEELDKRGSWSIGQYIKTIELYINLDRITVLQDPTNLLEDVYLPYLKRFIRSDAQTYCYPFQLKEGDKFKLTLLYLQKLKS
jgi:hypothetical protein